MKNRLGITAFVLVACAFSLQAQQNMYKLEGDNHTSMISLNQPLLIGGMYVFKAWPDGGTTNIPQAKVKKITQLTGLEAQTIYKIELKPSGTMVAKDVPVLKGGMYVFHEWRAGTLMSVRQADVKKIITTTGDQAFWVEQGLDGEKQIGNLAMQGGGQVIQIGTPPGGGNSTQAGPQNLSSVGGQNGTTGINGAPVGNWQYQGTPGASDAYAPANSNMNNGVPTMPAATNGSAPPTQQSPQ